MNNIYLIGMPGCGKSTIGEIISKEINREFIDLDEYIIEYSGKSIEELFSDGEPHFRSVETECLKLVSNMNNLIVATGGGIIETSDNDQIMRNSGIVIFIHTTPEKIMENSFQIHLKKLFNLYGLSNVFYKLNQMDIHYLMDALISSCIHIINMILIMDY